jgi:formate dehydrogenase alpha subunit
LTTTLLDLLLLTGHHGLAGCGVAPLAEENNDQGAVEMGATAEYLPGPADLEDRAARRSIADLWKEEVPQTPGNRLTDMLDQARAGTVKAMFIVGENPAGSLPPSAKVQEALQKLDLLVCNELFLTETASLAHVVLPACSYAEKEGTFTNTEGMVQPVRQAMEPLGESRPDWEILSALSVLMGYPLEYGDAKEILKEIRSLIPGYGLLGAAPTPPRPDEKTVDRYLTEGFRSDLAARYTLSEPVERQAGQVTFMSAQSLFHSGKYSRYAKGLIQIQAQGTLAINPADAATLGVTDGERVRLSNQQGEATVAVKVLERTPEGLAIYPEHFDEDTRRLLTVTADPQTGVPYCKAARVKIEKVS